MYLTRMVVKTQKEKTPIFGRPPFGYRGQAQNIPDNQLKVFFQVWAV